MKKDIKSGQSKGKGGTSKSEPIGPRSYLKQQDVPSGSLEDALRIPKAIFDNYAGRATAPLFVAKAVDVDPKGSQLRALSGASIAFGLIEGGAQASSISVTELARRILRPKSEGEDVVAKREAILAPRVFGEFLRQYDGNPFPRTDIGINVLESMGVPREKAAEVLQRIESSALGVGVIEEIRGKKYVSLKGAQGFPAANQEGEGPQMTQPDEGGLDPVTPPQNPESKDAIGQSATTNAANVLGQAIFLAHGKNKKPLEQLRRILDQFKVPYHVAADEPNLGRPIGTKVKEIMEMCNCAILLFTADEELFDKDGNSVWRPNENVIHELGASSYLYGSRIVILKEDRVTLSSNYKDLGYTSFETDKLDAKSLDVLKELIGFGIVRIST